MSRKNLKKKKRKGGRVRGKGDKIVKLNGLNENKTEF